LKAGVVWEMNHLYDRHAPDALARSLGYADDEAEEEE
jgi:hypothetical protein